MIRRLVGLLLAATLTVAATAIPANAVPLTMPTYPSTWPIPCAERTAVLAPEAGQPDITIGLAVVVHMRHCWRDDIRTSDVFTLNVYYLDRTGETIKFRFWPGEYHLSGRVSPNAFAMCVATGDNVRHSCSRIVHTSHGPMLGSEISTTHSAVNFPLAFVPNAILGGTPNCKDCWP